MLKKNKDILIEATEFLSHLKTEGYVYIDVEKKYLFKALKNMLDSLGISYEARENVEEKDYYNRPVYLHQIWIK